MMQNNNIIAKYSKQLSGAITPPADKSISHRAVILAALTTGKSSIKNLLQSSDVKSTVSCLEQLGVSYNYINNSECEVISTGLINLKDNKYSFNVGNSGTSARLLMGVMSGLPCVVTFAGDSSLNKRPMYRAIEPLINMGLKLQGENTNHLPITIRGGSLRGINYQLKVASAQVKSAILLAGLFCSEEVKVVEDYFTRDHTENMLKLAEIDINCEVKNNKKIITLPAVKKTLQPQNWNIPSDFSSSAFLIAAALLVEDSEITIKQVNLNPLRAGLLTALKAMGADISINYNDNICGELNGSLVVKYSELKAITVNKESVASMIDEFPILFVLAACAEGISTFLGIEELRYKESDRIKEIEENFAKLGIKTASTKDSLQIFGSRKLKEGGVIVDANLDHRIAMAFAILGLTTKQPITIAGAETINTSFANFVNSMQILGANISEENNNE